MLKLENAIRGLGIRGEEQQTSPLLGAGEL